MNKIKNTAKEAAGISLSVLSALSFCWSVYTQDPSGLLKVLTGLLFGAFTGSTIVYIFYRRWKPVGIQRQILKDTERYGITGIERKTPVYSRLASKLSDGKVKCLRIIVYTGDLLLLNLKETIKESMIIHEMSVKILIASNKSPILNEVWELEGSKKKKIHQGIFDIIDEIEKETNGRGSIEKLFYNTQVRAAIILLDDKWAWYTPYFPGILTENLISFELQNNGKESIINDCSKHFDKLWDKLDGCNKNKKLHS